MLVVVLVVSQCHFTFSTSCSISYKPISLYLCPMPVNDLLSNEVDIDFFAFFSEAQLLYGSAKRLIIKSLF